MGLQFGGHTATNRGGNHTIRTATRRRHADRQLLMLPNPHHQQCGGRRRDRRAWLRCQRVRGTCQGTRGWRRGLAAVLVGGGRTRAGLETRRIVLSTTGPTGVEGAGGTGGPGRGAGRRQQGLAAVPVGGGGAWPGFEPTRRAKLAARTVSEARGADGERAGRRPRAHRAARPDSTPATPGSPVGPQASKVGSRRRPARTAARPRHAETPPRRCGTGFSLPSRV